jgi:hypothetical protein
MFRPHIFRALFQKDIGGVAGVSDCWFDADLYTVDGGSGKVLDFVDYIDQTHSLRQPVAGKQVVVPAADAALSNSLSATFAGAEWYLSNRPASSWTYLIAGTGMEVISTYVPIDSGIEYFIVSTRPSNHGYCCSRTAAGTNRFLVIGPGGSFSSIVGAMPATTATYADHSSVYPSVDQWVNRVKSTVVASGAFGYVPTGVGSNAGSLMLGAGSGGLAFFASMRFRSVYLFQRVLASAERLIVQQWNQRTTGILP